MATQILSRKEHSSTTRLRAVEKLERRISDWNNPNDLGQRICVYTTGSYGRSDASKFSDLDLFIVSLEEAITKDRQLSRLEEIELLASIVHVNRELDLPPPDNDGSFLKVYPLSSYLRGLGKPSDDADNTFTGRLLLLLESKPLFGNAVYEKVKRDCIERYWVDYADHSDSFLPAFIINDILRFWRTLCINYEAGSAPNPAKRRAKNYKLKFSRLLTCFSAVIGIQAAFQKSGTLSATEAYEILDREPLDRIKIAGEVFGPLVSSEVADIFSMYDGFLHQTDCSKSDLYSKMEDPDFYKSSLADARRFGDMINQLMHNMAKEPESSTRGYRFVRYVTV